MNSIFKLRELEERFFAFVILCTIPYYCINLVIISISSDTSTTLVFIYIALLLISVGTLLFIQKKGVNSVAINIFSLFVLFSFTYYLPNSAGPIGGAGYVLQLIIVVLILMTKGNLKFFVTIALSGLAIVLFTDVLTFTGNLFYTRLLTDYFVNLLFFSVFILFFKYNLDLERKELTHKNEEVELLNEELMQQAEQIQHTNDEIQAIRDNLQAKVIERTEKLEAENKKLLEYSFINAHLVRAPMANIIGITQLNSENADFVEIKEGIEHMDQVVRKIANVLR